MFKKSMSMLLACAMCITMLASCGKKAASEQASKTEPNSVPAQSTSQPEDKPAEKADATKLVIDKAGDYTAEKGVKDVEIKADGVKLTKSTGLNSVTIGKEVGAGSVTLDGVEAKSILIKGGGKNSIHILGSKFKEAILEQMNALTRIVSDARSTIGEMQANSPAILEIEGTVKSLIMGKDAKDSTIDIKEGATLTNLMLNALTTVNASANITTVSVYASAVGSTLTVTAGATVATLATETKIELKGKGSITAAITQSLANLVGNLKAGALTVNKTPVLTTGMPNTAGGTATGTPTVKPITPVTPPADTTPDVKVDKTKLGDMLKVAAKDAAKVGTIWVQAESKYEPKADQHYVTKAQVDAYAEAIKAAQAIYDDANATQKQVDDAQTSIANANATFMAAGLNQKGVISQVIIVRATGIEIVKAPSKTLYNDKDKLELDGMQCKLTWSNGKTEIVDAKDFDKNGIITEPAQGDVLAGEQTATTKPKDIVVTARYTGSNLKDNTTVKVYTKDIHYVDSQASFEAALNDTTVKNVLIINNADVTVPNKAMRGDVYVEVSSGATLRDYENLGNIQDDTSMNDLIATYGSFVRTGTGDVDNLLFGAKGSGAGLELESGSFMSFVLSKPQKICQAHIVGGNATIQQQNKQPFIIKDGMLLATDATGTLKIAAADNSAAQPSAKKATLEMQGSGRLSIHAKNTLELMPGALVIADKGKDNFEISGTVTNNAGVCDNTTVKGLVGMVDKQLNTVTPDKWLQIDDVTISGNTVYGETLTANTTYTVQPDNPIDCEYLWCADDVTISGETSSTLILNDISYIGKKIKVVSFPKFVNVMGMNWRETSTVISKKAAKPTVPSTATSGNATEKGFVRINKLEANTKYEYLLNNEQAPITDWTGAIVVNGSVLTDAAGIDAQGYTFMHIREEADLNCYEPAKDFPIKLNYIEKGTFEITMPFNDYYGLIATVTGPSRAKPGEEVILTLTYSGKLCPPPSPTGQIYGKFPIHPVIVDNNNELGGEIQGDTVNRHVLKIIGPKKFVLEHYKDVGTDKITKYSFIMPNHDVDRLQVIGQIYGDCSQNPITFTHPGIATYGNAPQQLTVTGGTGDGAVKYSVLTGGNTVATLTEQGLLTILGAGDITVTATKAGDATHDDISANLLIKIAKATLTVPTDNTAPVPSDTVVKDAALKSINVTGNTAKMGDKVVKGTWKWTNEETIVTATGLQSITFTPDIGPQNYEPLMTDIQVELKP